jgi:serine/threonine-protein kinase
MNRRLGVSTRLFLRPAMSAFMAGALLASCGGGRTVSVPPTAPNSHFTTPANLALPVPPPPPAITPRAPSSIGRHVSAAHASFFAGEAALSNGVYYLALPNGNVFGYYSYLPDSNYIYHFDIGYLYVFDANDGKGGVYFYDFTSGHWWYTGRTYPFPYVYDFSRSALLYYYPDTNSAGHYTTNPRYFYNFNTGQIVSSPAAIVSTLAGSTSGTPGFTNGTGAAATFNFPLGAAVDSAGNMYIADSNNNAIRKITPAGVVSTLAGSGAVGFSNGTGTAATFSFPTGVAVDGSNNVYVGDQSNNAIRKITPGGVVSTLAGSGSAGLTDGTGTAASFQNPQGVAVDGAGNVYVADTVNNAIRKITPGGVVSTIAGSGSQGFANGTGAAATFYHPQDVAVDAGGTLFVADTFNNAIRAIAPGGAVTTLAGSGSAALTNGTGTAAAFNHPGGIVVDPGGSVYVADNFNHAIRRIAPGGIVTTIAGNGTAGFVNGTGTAATFNRPHGLAIDGAGNLYVSDLLNNAVRKIQ